MTHMMSTLKVNDLHCIYPVRGTLSLTGLAPNTSGSGFEGYPRVTPIILLSLNFSSLEIDV